jgi:N-acetyl-anhydromuramyl-L-alanine amidase AmpD
MAARASSKSRRAQPVTGLTRARVVWVSFLGAMTAVGGLFLIASPRPIPRLDGASLSPLAATTVATTDGSLTQTRARLDVNRWQAIVVHHSGSIVGSPASIEREHEARRFDGLGHHFIIGNGHGMEDGQVHIGYRWLDQKPGAHAAGPNARFYNDHAISICLVGDGDRRPFTPAQLATLQALVESLRKQLALPADRVLRHADIAPGVSDPGRFFPADLYGPRPAVQR